MKGKLCERVVAMLMLSLSACEVETIVAGTFEPDSGTGRDGDEDAGAGRGCTGPEDCAAGELCEKRGCDEPRGMCMPVPRLCTEARVEPVCGCDGISYFDDCLRQRSAVAIAHPGPCEATALGCSGGGERDCPGEAVCGRLPSRIAIGEPGVRCSPEEEPGQCWLLPVSCDRTTLGGDRFSTCDGTFECLDLCSALRTGQPLTLSMQCDSGFEREDENRPGS